MIAQFHPNADCEIRLASLTFRTSCHGSIAATALPVPPDTIAQFESFKETAS
jgi:hypothetical protein